MKPNTHSTHLTRWKLRCPTVTLVIFAIVAGSAYSLELRIKCSRLYINDVADQLPHIELQLECVDKMNKTLKRTSVFRMSQNETKSITIPDDTLYVNFSGWGPRRCTIANQIDHEQGRYYYSAGELSVAVKISGGWADQNDITVRSGGVAATSTGSFGNRACWNFTGSKHPYGPIYANKPLGEPDRRYLRIHNKTKENVKVYVSYFTRSRQGNWNWYNEDLKSYWVIERGESTRLRHDGFTINAYKVKVHAHSVGSSPRNNWGGTLSNPMTKTIGEKNLRTYGEVLNDYTLTID